MSKVESLRAWTGYKSPATEDMIRATILPGESFRAPPIEWHTPALAPFFPLPGPPEGIQQTSVSIAVTDAAVYLVALQLHRDTWTVASQTRIGASHISAVTVGNSKRRLGRQILGKVQEVVLLKLWWNDKREEIESRFIEAFDQGVVIQRLVSEWQSLGGGAARPTLAEELGKLAELRSSGVLTDAEWDRAKNLFLGKAPDAREQAVVLLGQLQNLYKAGALSEMEFNMKKWEVLSKN